ncbi:glycosyltransferase family 1 protein [Bdellovibrio sp. NC01]|uniref:glycosyltransferase family 1 protein n=1 Tax=Bdellovibrio sp. NC01 TaxID=2220073 RepID=UPI00115A9136|nr:glycosyltransferase family 1 protein [Bdellovibrio sp. NC01]QDK38156.1 hypothetical protein DOE51_11455 [Bdellovibrio sp. NC01]
MNTGSVSLDMIVFSHVRWSDVYQRLHHLMVRYARNRRIFFFEKPQIGDQKESSFEHQYRSGVHVVTPHIPYNFTSTERHDDCRSYIDTLMDEEGVAKFHLWYSDASALKYSEHLIPVLTIYDGFSNSLVTDHESEQILINKADLILNQHPQQKPQLAVGSDVTSDYLLKTFDERNQHLAWDQSWRCVADLEEEAMRRKIRKATELLTRSL